MLGVSQGVYMEAETALIKLKNEEISIHECFRALAQFEHWIVGASEQNGELYPVLNEGPDGHWLLVFSSVVAFQNYLKARKVETAPPYISIKGEWLFRNANSEQLQGIALDIGTEHTMPIYSAQFEHLQQWSQTLAVEYIIAALKKESKPDLLKALAGYPRFFLPVVNSENGNQIILTPDADNRQLAAIFTSEDAGDLFLKQAEADLEGSLQLQECSGSNLFSSLQSMPLDGLVFNPAGPIQPHAFSKALLDAIMLVKAEKEQ